MRKEAVVAWFKLLSRHLLGRNDKITRNRGQDSRFPYRYLNAGPLKSEAEVNAIHSTATFRGTSVDLANTAEWMQPGVTEIHSHVTSVGW
jgi:hypothetical protein